jgi:hypothetical protein
MINKLIAGVMLLFFATACTSQPIEQSQNLISYSITPEGEVISQLTFEVSNEGSDGLVLEAVSGESDVAWLSKSREKRSELNRFFYENDHADEEEERLDRKKSENWHTVIDGKSQKGYDIILADRGELGTDREPETSEKMYGYIVRYGYS